MMNFAQPLDLDVPARAVEFMRGYHAKIMAVATANGNENHVALLMPVLAEGMEPAQLRGFIESMRAENAPLAGFKLFPKGQSTNSGYAPSTEKAAALIDVLEETGVPLALHMEDPDEPDASKKEQSAIEKILPLLIERDGRPRDMKISVEHISTARALREVVTRGIWCTITPHHLGLCQEDFGIESPDIAEQFLRGAKPYFYCKPIIQMRENQEELRNFWLHGGYGKLMPGTDSAPHIVEKKEANPPAAGIFMGCAELAYREAGCADADISSQLQQYSKNAAEFYGIDVAALSDAKTPNEDNLHLVKNVRAMTAAFS